MRTRPNRLKTSLVLAAIASLAGLTGCQPEGMALDPQTGRLVTVTPPLSPIQTPPPPIATSVSGPTPIIVTVQPGQEPPAFPTGTPWPTFTPQPTPTRRPGPTATAMPLPQPASDAAGIIRYTVFGTTPDLAYSHLAVPVDGRGQAEHVPELIPLPPGLEFTPFQVLPSPDGRYTVLMEPVEPGGRPYVFDQVTGQVKALFQPYGGGSFFGWHPDGHHFLFWIDSVGLWLIDAETLESTTLALPEGPVQGAAISPDGLRVAYIAENRPTLGSLWFVSTAGSDAEPQFDAGDISYLYPDAWSPDGTRIVYYGNCVQPLPKGEVPSGGPLCLFDIRTQERRALNLPFVGFSPTWSPDSRYIAATGLTPDESSCSGKDLSASEQDDCQYVARSIYILDTVTGEVRLLTSGIAPAWSPDGSMLAFLSIRSGAPEVWTIYVDGTGLRQLTTDGQRKSPYQLTWSREVRK